MLNKIMFVFSFCVASVLTTEVAFAAPGWIYNIHQKNFCIGTNPIYENSLQGAKDSAIEAGQDKCGSNYIEWATYSVKNEKGYKTWVLLKKENPVLVSN